MRKTPLRIDVGVVGASVDMLGPCLGAFVVFPGLRDKGKQFQDKVKCTSPVSDRFWGIHGFRKGDMFEALFRTV